MTRERWGVLRSLAHSHDTQDYSRLWEEISAWPDEDERRDAVIPYLLAQLDARPHIAQHALVDYTPWFDELLLRAMRLELADDHTSALLAYEQCLRLKSDCLPAAIGAHRLRGYQHDLATFLAEHPWEHISGAYGRLKRHEVAALASVVHDPTHLGELQDFVFEHCEHQFTLYPATFEFIPFLGRMLFESEHPDVSRDLASYMLCYGSYVVWQPGMSFEETISRGQAIIRGEEVETLVNTDHSFKDLVAINASGANPNGAFDISMEQRKCFGYERDGGRNHEEVEVAMRMARAIRAGEMRYDEPLQRRRPETPFLSDFVPKRYYEFFEWEEALAEDSFSWTERNVDQAIASNLPIYVYRYERADDPILKRLLEELINVSGDYGRALLNRDDI